MGTETAKSAEPPKRGAQTRTRIVRSAARLFRERGYARTSVDELMGEAGLTRGGFYAHFRNKAALFAAAIEASFAESRENLLARGLEALEGEAWLARAAARYVTDDHVDTPGEGCAIPALANEVARAEPSVREAFDRELDDLLGALTRRLPGGDGRRRAIRHLARWVGALTMARAVADPALRAEILAACRESDGEPRG